MKNKFYLFVLLLLPLCGHAQLLDNKLNLYMGYSAGIFHGNGMVTEGSFTFPAFYANLKGLHGLALKGVVRQKYYSLGLGFEHAVASGWNYSHHQDFTGAGAKNTSLYPVLQLHPRFSGTGLGNRLRAIAELAPAVGYSNVSLVKPLFDIHTEQTPYIQQLNSHDFYYGMRGSLGLEYGLSNGIGFYGMYTWQHNRVTSRLHADDWFTTSMLTIGLLKKLKRDKRFFY